MLLGLEFLAFWNWSSWISVVGFLRILELDSSEFLDFIGFRVWISRLGFLWMPSLTALSEVVVRPLVAAEVVRSLLVEFLCPGFCLSFTVSLKISQNPSTNMARAPKMLPKSIQNEAKLSSDPSLGPPGGHPVENTSRRRLQDTPWTPQNRLKSPKRPPKPSPNRPNIDQKSSKKPTEFQDVFRMDFRACLDPKCLIFHLFLDAFGAENRWNNENIDFREFALTLQREHRISHFVHENFMKFRFQIASETSRILRSSFSSILAPKLPKKDPQNGPKST